MFISTLGKDPSNKSNCDDMYGELIRDILGDDDEEEDDTDIDKTTTDISNDKVNVALFIVIPKYQISLIISHIHGVTFKQQKREKASINNVITFC